MGATSSISSHSNTPVQNSHGRALLLPPFDEPEQSGPGCNASLFVPGQFHDILFL